MAGIRAKVGDHVRVDHAVGVPRPTRLIPSPFDAFLGATNGDSSEFDQQREFERALEIAPAAEVAIVVVGDLRWAAEHVPAILDIAATGTKRAPRCTRSGTG